MSIFLQTAHIYVLGRGPKFHSAALNPLKWNRCEFTKYFSVLFQGENGQPVRCLNFLTLFYTFDFTF